MSAKPRHSLLILLTLARFVLGENRRLKRVHYFDIVKGVNTSPTSLVGWLDNYIVPSKSFPLLFLTYSDLNELSDAVLYLLATRKDTVVVFIPHYCAGAFPSNLSKYLVCTHAMR
jgi:hypothetical protein